MSAQPKYSEVFAASNKILLRQLDTITAQHEQEQHSHEITRAKLSAWRVYAVCTTVFLLAQSFNIAWSNA